MRLTLSILALFLLSCSASVNESTLRSRYGGDIRPNDPNWKDGRYIIDRNNIESLSTFYETIRQKDNITVTREGDVDDHHAVCVSLHGEGSWWVGNVYNSWGIYKNVLCFDPEPLTGLKVEAKYCRRLRWEGRELELDFFNEGRVDCVISKEGLQ